LNLGTVPIPLMPKGVEHSNNVLLVMHKIKGADSVDAERR
jgi:hypothetical protein